MACPGQCNTCPTAKPVLVQNPPNMSCPPGCPPLCPPGCPPRCPPDCVPCAPECCTSKCCPPRRMCRYIQPPRPESYRPTMPYRPPVLKMEDDTIYRKSYLPVDGNKPAPIRPPHNLCIGQGRISDDTVHRLSYMGHMAAPPCPIIPCEHKLIGEGPMQDITTQKHDYVPKPIRRIQPCYPIKNLFTADCPLSDLTTNRLSYMPVDVDSFKVHAIRQLDNLDRPCGRMEEQTIQKLSYLPWKPQVPEDMPWKMRQTYAPPYLPMEDNTVHRLSFQPPGHFVECTDGGPNCVPCPEQACTLPACTAQCCCPRAAC